MSDVSHNIKLTNGKREVFNILTDNGKNPCLFMDNGQLYVNGEYINTRNFKAVTDDGRKWYCVFLFIYVSIPQFM